MKEDVILLLDGDADTYAAVLTAAENTGLDVRSAKVRRNFAEISQFPLDHVAAIVLDYNPDLHGPAIMEALERSFPARPIIFVSNADDLRHLMVVAGGAARHLIKPITAHRLIYALETLVHKPGCRCLSCDRWGHPLVAGKDVKGFAA